VLKEKASGRAFLFMNTHFGFGDDGQVKSAKLIADFSKKISEHPTVVVGDFNMTPSSVGYAEITTHFTDVNNSIIDHRSTSDYRQTRLSYASFDSANIQRQKALVKSFC
jgi:endonuclease/exonuclease/phosphatase family metal-dependent hydrolase